MRYRHLVTGLIVTTDRELGWPYEQLLDPEPEIVHLGGGWYQVRFPDGRVAKAHGRAAAEALT